MYIDLKLAKQHLNLEPDYVEEDEYILQLIDASEAAVRVHINDDLGKIARCNGGLLPAPITQAMLLMLGHLYQNREIVGNKVQVLPQSYAYLLELYRNFSN